MGASGVLLPISRIARASLGGIIVSYRPPGGSTSGGQIIIIVMMLRAVQSIKRLGIARDATIYKLWGFTPRSILNIYIAQVRLQFCCRFAKRQVGRDAHVQPFPNGFAEMVDLVDAHTSKMVCDKIRLLVGISVASHR